MNRRVVVTGMSGVTGLGNCFHSIFERISNNESAIRYMKEWEEYEGLHTKLAAPVPDFQSPTHYPRKKTRAMGRVALLGTVATEQALRSANFLDHPSLTDGSTGVAYGSSTGSTEPALRFANLLNTKSTRGITATTYIKMMSHTAAVNIGIFFGAKGRLIPTSSACTSASQAIGYSYETIKYGHQDVMIAGGSEELCPTEAVVFDTLFATSVKNTTPKETPSPYDKDRDGLVVGEGAGTLILEELEHAQRRNAPVFAEVVGFSTNSDAHHITQPDPLQMKGVMISALKSAEIEPEAIHYINGHATATELGDIAESQATFDLFAGGTPISSLKGHFGHTLGACGAIEAWLSIEMMNRSFITPTLNLKTPDPRCAKLNYVMEAVQNQNMGYVMTNNFGFGGLNTSLIFKKY